MSQMISMKWPQHTIAALLLLALGAMTVAAEVLVATESAIAHTPPANRLRPAMAVRPTDPQSYQGIR